MKLQPQGPMIDETASEILLTWAKKIPVSDCKWNTVISWTVSYTENENMFWNRVINIWNISTSKCQLRDQELSETLLLVSYLVIYPSQFLQV
jgi:hypothetical protein